MVQGTLQSVSNAIDLLELLAHDSKPRGLTELSGRLGLSKPATQRALWTLKERRLVRQDPKTRKYQLGLRLWELGWAVVADLDIRETARPYLYQLVEQTQESALMAVLDMGIDGAHVVYIDKVDSNQPVRTFARVGASAPVHCTATGRAIAAFLPPDIARAAFPRKLKRLTEKTVTSHSDLEARLTLIRQRRWEASSGECWVGVASVAAPIWNHSGLPVAAVAVVMPAERLNAERTQQTAKLIRSVSDDLSRQLGYIPEDSGQTGYTITLPSRP